MNSIIDSRVAEFVEIVLGFMMLRHRLKPVLPEELARAKARLTELLPEGQEWSKHDLNLFFSVGAILSHSHDPMTMGELSQTLDVPLSTATRMVDQLVKLQYARRLPDPGDRRLVRIALTDSGQQMYRNIQTLIETRIRHLLTHFTTDEQETLLALLRKLHTAIIEETVS